MQVDNDCDLHLNTLFYLLAYVRLLGTLMWLFEVWLTKEHSGKIVFHLF